MPGKRAAPALVAMALACTAAAGPAQAHRRAPEPVPAWYMTAASGPDLLRQAKAGACAFAKRQPRASRLMLFDFGAARKYPSGGFGAQLRGIHPFRNGAVLDALKGAARAYKRCHRRGSATIVYGNSNSLPGSMSTLDAYEAGLHQGLTVRALRRFQRQHHYRRQRAAAAGDIEPGFELPGVSKALVSGANQIAYYNFGNAGGCPGQPLASGCYNGWDLGDLGEVSMGGHSLPLPEIYHQYEAVQWARIQDRWDGRFFFAGVTGAPNEPLSPTEGWKQLKQTAEGVRRELVSIRDGRGAARAGGANRQGANRATSAEVGAPMTAAVQPHLVARPEGFFSTSNIYPLENEWVVSDRRRFIAVDAGADPVDPSTGVLGIFRQNYVRVTQSQRTIEVPGTGQLELTGAPTGAARAAPSGPPELRFEGAGGTGGVLDLRDGTVELDRGGEESP
ncbi:MAG: hypothetical protein E6G49_02415 [Actinobacteria bacterium]|nr:MAG: hypothetical protein E6G49_02415 [Actinomycetota bacterium]